MALFFSPKLTVPTKTLEYSDLTSKNVDTHYSVIGNAIYSSSTGTAKSWEKNPYNQ